MTTSRPARCVVAAVTLAGCLCAAQPAAAQSLTPTPPPSTTGGVFLTDLVGATVNDAKRLPSRDTLTWLAIGAAIAGASTAIDRESSEAMSSSRALEEPFGPGETIGGARLQMMGGAAAYALGHLTNNREVTEVGSDLVRAHLLTQALTGAVKMSVRRGRPDGTQFSFFSGHSAVTFATATVLDRHYGWKVGIPAYAVASYVAASRVQAKRHYLSDVAFGAAVGIAVGRTVTIGRGGARFALSPMASSGGGGVSFTWVGQHD